MFIMFGKEKQKKEEEEGSETKWQTVHKRRGKKKVKEGWERKSGKEEE